MRILVVDDDKSILALLKQYLAKSCGHDVVAAECGMRALEKLMIEKEPFDCFLVDIQMPNVDGITLCRKIREIECYQSTPIVMLTAMTQLEHIDRAFEAGADDYISKPFELMELKSRVENSHRKHAKSESTEARRLKFAKFRVHKPEPRSLAFADAINFSDVERTLSYTSFENYILQMSRIGMFGASVFSVQIAGARKVYDQCSPVQFRKVVQLAARAITDATENDGGFSSYRGRGVFLCFHKGKDSFSTENLEISLNRKFILEMANSFISIPASLKVGKRHSLRWLSKADALKALYAATNDLPGFGQNYGIPGLDGDTDGTRTLGNPEDSRMEKQAYKTFLHDILDHQELPIQYVDPVSRKNAS